MLIFFHYILIYFLNIGVNWTSSLFKLHTMKVDDEHELHLKKQLKFQFVPHTELLKN